MRVEFHILSCISYVQIYRPEHELPPISIPATFIINDLGITLIGGLGNSHAEPCLVDHFRGSQPVRYINIELATKFG